jgi:hypothetical protein
VTTQAPGDLADTEPHLHQAAQAASLLEFEVRVVRSHDDPGYSRCRTWFANLARSKGWLAAGQFDELFFLALAFVFALFLYGDRTTT